MSELWMPERLERRALTRHVCHGSLPLAARAGHEYWKVALRDISPGGLGMLIDRAVDSGSLVAVELFNRAGNFWHLKVIRVVHVSPRASGLWVAGNAFLQQLTEEEFDDLVGDACPANAMLPSLS